MIPRVLVTGGKGQVGKAIQKLQKQYKFEIIAPGKEDLDITSYDSIIENIEKYNPSVIVNSAAYTAVDKAEDDMILCHKVNAIGPRNISDICKTRDILLVHLSTDYVFNGLSSKPYNERDKEDPLNVYGKTKLDGEQAIKSLLDKFIIIRTSWVFGIFGNNFPKTIIGLSQKQTELSVINDIFGSPTSARSLAKLILHFCDQYLQSGSLKYGIYHFTNSPQASWYDFASMIIEVAEELGLINQMPNLKGVSSEEYYAKAPKPKYSVLSNSKIREIYNIDIDDWKSELSYTLGEIKNEI